MDTLIKSTLGTTLVSALEPIIASAANTFIDNHFSKRLRAAKQAAQQPIHDTFEEWLETLFYSLQLQGYGDEELRLFFQERYQELEIFLTDPKVSEELLKPFLSKTTKYQIDSKRLAQRWQELQLLPLPEDIDTASVNRAYLQRLKKAGIVTPKLRRLFSTQPSQEQTNYLETLRAIWPDFDLDNYAERIKTRYQVLDLSVLTPPTPDNRKAALLKAVFIPQWVKKPRPRQELPQKIWYQLHDLGEYHEGEWPKGLNPKYIELLKQTWAQDKPESVLAAVSKPANQRLVILGDPGSGKSTLARYLLLSLLEESHRQGFENPGDLHWMDTLSGHLPLLVELREYTGNVAAQPGEDFLDYFQYLGKSYTRKLKKLKAQLKTRPSLLIFDGLDEVFNPAERDKITQKIIGFAGKYPKARVIVTSRTIGYQGQGFQAANFNEYILQDLAHEQIKTFARGWFSYQNQPKKADFHYNKLQKALQESQAMQQLAGNPLLLTMIAIIVKPQKLPRERSKLYEQAAKVLCHSWDMTKKTLSLTDMHADFKVDDKLALLRRIAWRIQAAPQELAGHFITEVDLQAEIESYLETRWQLSTVETGRLSHTLIEQLRQRNLILCLYQAQVYGFVHQTFLKYFCAAEIVCRFEKQQTLSFKQLKMEIFLAHYQDETWHEVLRLICGMVEPRFAGQLISAIVPKRKEAFKKTAELVLAVQCLAEVVDINQIAAVAQQVLESLCGWFEQTDIDGNNADKMEQQFEENALPAIESIGKTWPGRETFLAWLSEPKKRTSKESGFGRLVAAFCSDDEETKEALITLSNTKSRMAFEALARCFGPQEDILRLLQRRALNDSINRFRRDAIDALAKHYKDAPNTRILLEQLAQNGPLKDVRSAAVLALAKHYPDTPDILPRLRQIAQKDASESVRRSALWALVKHDTDAPDTPTLLRQFARNDSDESVRSFAVSALAEHYTSAPETLTLLRRIAQNDQHEEVRGAAIKGLLEHDTDAPGTLPLLRQIAQNDPRKNIRCAVIEALVKYYIDAPDTPTLLGQIAQNEPHRLVRRAAVSTLVKHYVDAPDTLPLLRQIAQNDQDKTVRRAAIEVLVNIDAPDTPTLLGPLAQNDQHKAVRRKAVHALVRHYIDAPDTLTLLGPLAQNAPDEETRHTAVGSLAKHYANAPDTLPLLRLIAQKDPSEYVRRTAIYGLAHLHNVNAPEIQKLLRQFIRDRNPSIRRAAIGTFAKNCHDETWQKLLSLEFKKKTIVFINWLDPKEVIDNERVKAAATALKLSTNTIQKYYETIAKKIPLHLSWVKKRNKS
jgi:predicted NACHT family NTPase/HEAT repeat protein